MSELMVIFSFVLLAGLIVFTFVTKVHQRSIVHEERKLELKARIAEAEAGTGTNNATDKRLEERVRVLERLATDRGQDLALQIEELRDRVAPGLAHQKTENA